MKKSVKSTNKSLKKNNNQKSSSLSKIDEKKLKATSKKSVEQILNNVRPTPAFETTHSNEEKIEKITYHFTEIYPFHRPPASKPRASTVELFRTNAADEAITGADVERD